MSVGQAIEYWLDLLESFPSGDMKTVVESRAHQALDCPFFLLANLLDHRYAGRRLTPNHISKACMARQLPYTPSLVSSQIVSPISWLQAGIMAGFSHSITNVAIRLCSRDATTGNLERNWSTMGHTYSKSRMKLGVKKAGQLGFIHRHLNKSVPVVNDDSDSNCD